MKQLLFFSLIALLILSGCRKDKETIDNTVARDNSTSENYFNDLYKVVDDVSGATEGIRDYEIGCIDNVTVDTESDPKTILIDFGTDDCVGNDGRIRKGKIFVTYTGPYRAEGTVITITPQNYSVNGYTVQGSKVVTNLGADDNGNPHFSVSVDGSISAPGNAYTLQFESERVRTWIAGSDTYTIWDDVYEITGNGNGTNRFGNPYNIHVLSPLRIEIGCPWIVSGSIKIEPEGTAFRTIDFGSGACNGGFTVTVNGVDYPISGGD